MIMQGNFKLGVVVCSISPLNSLGESAFFTTNREEGLVQNESLEGGLGIECLPQTFVGWK